jgi:hypothetical protein
MWVWLDASRFPQTTLQTISAAVVAPAGKWSLGGGDLCQSGSHAFEPANTSRIGIRTNDDEIVVHDIAPVDAITISNKLVLPDAIMDQQSVGVAASAYCKRLAGSDGNDMNSNTGCRRENGHDVTV